VVVSSVRNLRVAAKRRRQKEGGVRIASGKRLKKKTIVKSKLKSHTNNWSRIKKKDRLRKLGGGKGCRRKPHGERNNPLSKTRRKTTKRFGLGKNRTGGSWYQGQKEKLKTLAEKGSRVSPADTGYEKDWEKLSDGRRALEEERKKRTTLKKTGVKNLTKSE